MVQHGIVKFFDARPGKRFGFLIVLDELGRPTEEEIFFSYEDGRFTSHDGESPTLDGPESIVDQNKQRRSLRDPQKDDKIVFSYFNGPRGVRAKPWTFLSLWESKAAALAARPSYRVLRISTDLFQRPDGSHETTVVWEGQNRYDLSCKFYKRTRVSYGRVKIDDMLAHSSIEDGWIVNNYRFEKLMDGEWRECKDPRVELGDVPENAFRKYAPVGLRR